MRGALLLFISMAVFQVPAQNLVPDSSFENNMGIPINFSGIGYSTTWSRSTQGTTDLFCSTKKRKQRISVVDVPKNAMGYQYAHSGSCYAGFFLYSHGNYREYLQTPLSKRLEKGKTYFISLHVSLADYARTTIDQIGVCFNDSELHYASGDVITDLHPVYISLKGVGNDTANWVQVTGKYKARGGEAFMMLGSYKIKSVRKTRFPLPKGLRTVINKTSQRDAYFYVDDVCVKEWVNPPPEPAFTTVARDSVPSAPYRLPGNILFETGSASLRADRIPELDELASYLNGHSNIRIIVTGHTDNVGSKRLNKKLSDRRARSIAEYLQRAGVAPGRIVTQGMGDEEPLVPNDSESSRAANRRVEITFKK